MTSDHSTLEAELRELRAAALDEAFLNRLEESVEGTWTRLSQQEIRFENLLRDASPAKLDPAFLADLETIVRDVPFITDEKIVPFPKVASVTPARRSRPMWGAAAAVALIGAATALMMPAGKGPDTTPRRLASAPSSTPSSSATGNFIPAGFNRGLSEIHDEGVVWKSNRQPHSVVRVVYKDLVTFKDASGRTMQVEQPRVEYMLVPAKTD
jgi:hypothetical protein